MHHHLLTRFSHSPVAIRYLPVAIFVACAFGTSLLSLLSTTALAAPPNVAQASPAKGIWDGVFNDAQADRGKSVFTERCAPCHDDANGDAPNLADASFMRRWEGHSLDRLSTMIRDKMPADDANSVSPAQKLDAMTHILRLNGFPSGQSELTADSDRLALIRIVRKGGPGPLAAGAMVQVVGCLSLEGGHTWQLIKGTEPEATTLDPQTPAEAKAVAESAPGAQTVGLLDFLPGAEIGKGQRLEVKGFLIRSANTLAVNVLTIRTIAPSCE